MKTMRTRLVLSACLLGALLAGWLMTRTGYNPQVAIPSSQPNPSSVPAAEAVAHSTPSREASRGPLAEALQPGAELQQAIVNPALADPGSPDNSEDWDQNREWARKYPAEALKWLENAPDGPRRETMAEIVCPELAQTDPARAVALAEQCNSSGTNFMKALRDGLGQQWAEQDMQATSAWALAKPAGEDRDRLLGRIALVKSKTNPEEAAQWVAEQMSPGAVQDEAAISVIYQWASRDANAAMAWVQSFPDGNLRYRAILEVQNIQAARNIQ
jgi:hypothetical protein